MAQSVVLYFYMPFLLPTHSVKHPIQHLFLTIIAAHKDLHTYYGEDDKGDFTYSISSDILTFVMIELTVNKMVSVSDL